jgi:hypothetical protein
MAFTPNDFVRVKPTEAGWKAIRKHYDNLNKGFSLRGVAQPQFFKVPIPDKDGYIKDQFWCVMQYFEWSIGRDNNFEDMILEPKK